MEWHVQYRCDDGHRIVGHTTPERAIEAICLWWMPVVTFAGSARGHSRIQSTATRSPASTPFGAHEHGGSGFRRQVSAGAGKTPRHPPAPPDPSRPERPWHNAAPRAGMLHKDRNAFAPIAERPRRGVGWAVQPDGIEAAKSPSRRILVNPSPRSRSLLCMFEGWRQAHATHDFPDADGGSGKHRSGRLWL